jgi:cell fate regulator YaaT (PSP1 superfamily)
MSCNSCSSTIKGIPAGCKSNGACADGSCDKLNVFDWLANMELPSNQKPFDMVEVRFKNGRKGFYRNTKELSLSMGDVVAVETSPGHDIGVVSLTGELVRVQMKKKRSRGRKEEPKQIYRKASQRDIDIWNAAKGKELEVQRKSRLIISRLQLKMKLSDVEFQGDGNKATFYYTADERVDFRQLIRELAGTFGIRVEMKQVGLRQEASRLGGIGSCGRELCCSTWLTDFRSVSTSAARYQQLSLNPQKLAGQCGKLKCCLNYELDSYLDALREFPKTNLWLHTQKGTAVFQKMDIFKGWIWYAYKDNPVIWHKLTLEQTNQIIELNKKNNKVNSLEEFSSEHEYEKETESVFTDVVGQDSLTRFDKPKKSRRRKKGRGNPKGKFRNSGRKPQKKKN